LSEEFGEVIYSYTQKQAIEDGVLADISGQKELKELVDNAGFKAPVVMTSHLWGTIEEGMNVAGQDLKGRLWDVLFMAMLAFKNFKEDKHLVPFQVLMRDKSGRMQKLDLWLCFNEAEGFCIMYPEDY